jgi:hypothetical protein
MSALIEVVVSDGSSARAAWEGRRDVAGDEGCAVGERRPEGSEGWWDRSVSM